MRTEQAHLFLLGALLFAGLWVISRSISSRRVKMHLRAIFSAIFLGAIVVPGHGEVIIAPTLAVFFPPWRSQLFVLGGFYFFIWWGIAFAFLKKVGLTHHSSGTPNGAP